MNRVLSYLTTVIIITGTIVVIMTIVLLPIPPFRLTVYNQLAPAIKDFATFGWSNESAEDWQELLPNLKRVETFSTKVEFQEYLLKEYGPEQKIHFACTDKHGQGPLNTRVKVSEIINLDCRYGFMAIYVLELP